MFSFKLDDIKIGKKLVLLYILAVLIPLLLVGLILTSVLRNLALEQAIREAAFNVERVKKRILQIMQVPADLSDKLYVDSNLERIISQDYGSTLEVVEAYRQYKEFDYYLNMYREIKNICVYSENKALLENWHFMKVTEEIARADWYRRTVENNGRIGWENIPLQELNYEARHLCLTRLLKSISGKHLGVLVIYLDNDFLSSLFEQETFDLLLIDQNGYVVTARDRSLIGRRTEDLNLPPLAGTGTEHIYDLVYNNKPSKMIVDTLSLREMENNFQIIAIFPIDSIIGEAGYLSLLGFSLIACSLLLSLGLLSLFSSSLSRRINMLSMDMRRVVSRARMGGDIDYTSNITGKDEIGRLSKDLNLMVENIKKLTKEVYEANFQKQQLLIWQKDMKLKVLANQINPHFLFNALETIRMKAHIKGEEEIARIIMLLGKIIRRNLELDNQPVPLRSELELVENYLEIQKFRYGDKINYEIEEFRHLENYPILPLLIQPVVENTIIHGLENKEGRGKVWIKFARDNGELRIIVTDDGVGIDRKKLVKLQKLLAKSESQEGIARRKIGLQNVHQRIKLYYGEEYGLRINSIQNQGTTVEIILPGSAEKNVQSGYY